MMQQIENSASLSSPPSQLLPVQTVAAASSASQPPAPASPSFAQNHTLVLRTGLMAASGRELFPDLLGSILSQSEGQCLPTAALTCRSWRAIAVHELCVRFGAVVEKICFVNERLAANERRSFNREYVQRMRERMWMMSVPSKAQGLSVQRALHAGGILLQSLSKFVSSADDTVRENFVFPANATAPRMEQKMLKIWDCHVKDPDIGHGDKVRLMGMLARGEVDALLPSMMQDPYCASPVPKAIAHALMSKDEYVEKALNACCQRYGQRMNTMQSLSFSTEAHPQVVCGNLFVKSLLLRKNMDKALTVLDRLPFALDESFPTTMRESIRRIRIFNDSSLKTAWGQEVVEVADAIADGQQKLGTFKTIVHALVQEVDDENGCLYPRIRKLLLDISKKLEACGNATEAKKLVEMISGNQVHMKNVHLWAQTGQAPFLIMFEREIDIVSEIIISCICRMGVKKAIEVAKGLKHVQAKTAAFQNIALYFLSIGDVKESRAITSLIPQKSVCAEILRYIEALPVAYQDLLDEKDALPLMNLAFQHFGLTMERMGAVLPFTVEDAEKCLDTKVCLNQAQLRVIFRHIARFGNVKKAMKCLSGLSGKYPRQRLDAIPEIVIEAVVRAGRLDEVMKAAEEMQWPQQMIAPLCQALYVGGQANQANAIVDAHLATYSPILFDREFCSSLLLNGGVDILIKKFLPNGDNVSKENLPPQANAFFARMEDVVAFLVETSDLRKAIGIVEMMNRIEEKVPQVNVLEGMMSRLRLTD